MNYSTAVFLLNPQVRCIACTYEVDKDEKLAARVSFKSLDKEVTAGDLVLVPTGTRHGYTVVKVVETDIDSDFDSN